MNINDAVQLSASELKKCFLCGSKTRGWVGAFIPSEPRLWPGGATPVHPEKTRAIFYLLCPKCKERPGVADTVEQKMSGVDGLPQ